MRARFLVACLLLFGSGAVTRAQEVLFGGTTGSVGGGFFGTIDLVGATWTTIGDPTTAGPLPGLARDSADNFYGSNNASGGGAGATLIRIDPSTGLLIQTIGLITDTADDAGLKMSDICFQPRTDVLFGLCSTTGKQGVLYTIDLLTGDATAVGDTSLNDGGGMAFAPNGKLYVVTASSTAVIAEIDPSDASIVGTTHDSEVGADALAVRSDGVIFGKEPDDSRVFTIDPSDGSVTPSIIIEDVPAEIASMVFGPPTPVDVDSYFLPRSVKLKLNAAKPLKSRLVSAGFFDLGSQEVDLSAGATLDVGDYEVTAPELTPNKKGTVFSLKQAGLKFLVKPDKKGSSRATFKIDVKDDLAGLIDPDAVLLLHFVNPAIDAEGAVTLAKGKYKLGKKPGALISPEIYLYKVAGKLKGGGLDALTLKLGIATNGTTPEVAPDLVIDFGAEFEASVPSGSFVKKGDRFVFKGAPGGLTSVILDYLRETLTIKAKGVDLGDFSEGPQPVSVTATLGGAEREVTVRMVRKGKSLKY